MAKNTIQVVLKDDVEHLGSSGELVRVKPGYARNYLIPQGLAVMATRGNIAQIEHEQKLALARAAKARAEAEGMAAALEGFEISIPAQAGEGGKLFGSVTARDIADAMAGKAMVVDRKRLQLDEPIKELGHYDIPVKFAAEVSATIKVHVVAAD
jgi:large subunit ribosomal protein L9